MPKTVKNVYDKAVSFEKLLIAHKKARKGKREKKFEAREEDLARLDEEDKNFMQKDEANRNKKCYYLQNQLEKNPYSLKKIKDNITKAIEQYVETIDYENAYFNEKYYLNGLKDGMKLMSKINRKANVN